MSQKNGSEGQGDVTEDEVPRGTAAAIWDQVGTLVLAIVIALTIRTFVIEPFRIPSGSMFPTLLVGDHLFVNKFLYGPRVPFTDWRLPGLRMPERGDVVVFEVAKGDARNTPSIAPADRYPDLPRDDFVKRILGLPGDRVTVREGLVRVNGQDVEQVATGDVFVDSDGRELIIRDENLLGCGHQVLDDAAIQGRAVLDLVVPEGRYLMVGDNRDHSNDSRVWGTVRLAEMKGPAFILYWSWSVNGNALQFFNPLNWWNADKRWDRIFARVQCEDLPDPTKTAAVDP
jgi:signal peptidase I